MTYDLSLEGVKHQHKNNNIVLTEHINKTALNNQTEQSDFLLYFIWVHPYLVFHETVQTRSCI